jgi:hypothetical protein
MHNTAPYVERIKEIALKRDGIVLSDEEAYERLVRLIPLVKVVYQLKQKPVYGKRK